MLETSEGLEPLANLPVGKLDKLGPVVSLASPSGPSVWVVSVASKTKTDAFLTRLASLGFQEIHLFKAGRSQCGISTCYREPEKLGGDRFLGMVAAWRRQRRASIVIDMGTTITIDALDAGGFHLGGVIMPGTAMSVDSLKRSTARLDVPVATAENDELFAKDTATAMVSGCRKMAVAALQKTVAVMRLMLGKNTAVLVSGGNAEQALAALDGKAQHCPFLVLEGLSVYATERSPGPKLQRV